MAEQTEIFLAYICPGCLGLFDGPGACDDCGVELTENVIKVSHPHGEAGCEVLEMDFGSSPNRVGELEGLIDLKAA